MKTLAANTALKNVWKEFAVQASESTQLSISVDGTTFTNTGDAFTGTKVFKDAPIGLFIKFNKQVYITDSGIQL